jgi:hypothetical protein
MKSLLLVTALAEGATGVALLAIPAEVVLLLLGVPLETPAAVTAGRLVGSALFALGAACALALRNEKSPAVIGLTTALTMYHVLAAIVLAYAGIAIGLTGDLLWPAVLVHAAMAGWCVACLGTASKTGIDSRSR